MQGRSWLLSRKKGGQGCILEGGVSFTVQVTLVLRKIQNPWLSDAGDLYLAVSGSRYISAGNSLERTMLRLVDAMPIYRLPFSCLLLHIIAYQQCEFLIWMGRVMSPRRTAIRASALVSSEPAERAGETQRLDTVGAEAELPLVDNARARDTLPLLYILRKKRDAMWHRDSGSGWWAKTKASIHEEVPAPLQNGLALVGQRPAWREMPSPMASLEHDKRSLVHQRRLAEAPAQQNKRTTQKNPSPHEGRMEEVPLGQHPFVRQKVEELVETRVPREQTVMKAVSRLATLRTTSQYHASSVGKWETENFETWVKSYGGREAADDLPPQEQRRAVGFPTWRAPPPTPNGYGSRQTLGGGIGWRRPCGWSSSGCGTRSPNALEALTLPVGQTHWEKGVHCRVLESVNREATRMAIVQSEFSRNVAGRVDADAGKAMMDKDASSWWPNPKQQKDAEAKVLSVMGERNFNCLLAATLLVNPVVQEYIQWLVQAEAKGVRELTVLLEEEMAIARGGTRLAFGAELMELHLRGLAARPATWKDGPSSELLLWLANQHLRNRQNVLPRQKGGRLPRSRLLASPSLGARVLDPIEEEDLPGEGSESGLGGAGITDKLSPAGRRPGSATRSPTSKSTLQLERCGFSLKDKICLRGEIPGLNLILRDLSQQYKDKDPNKAVAMMREAILISLGDALFSRMMERRALKWHPAGSGKKTGTFSRKERLQVAPLNQWKDLLR